MSVTTMVKKLAPFFLALNLRRILDYGAGTLRNSYFLMEKGFQVYVVETLERLARLHGEGAIRLLAGHYDPDTFGNCRLLVDAAIANYVLNIIEDPEQRLRAVVNIHHNLKPGGYFLAEVRPAFTDEELDRLILPVGFAKVGEFRREKSLAALYRKV